ncbi:surfeit locus protein 6 [Holotrichia oblita]|uniref:Surfeit locus protein 6 n=1 Tax=Holotrichia oblita TaxID=644536 RepID=A0ACB9SXM5_HOLOL|nr:surfeit locus protein 6 [Holotrichia oblita]
MATNKIKKFDQRRLEEILKSENQFITNLFSILALPQNNQNDDDEDSIDVSPKKIFLPTNKTSRASSLVELQNRINKLKNKNNTYKEKIQKRNLKNRLKKKIKQQKRNSTQKEGKVTRSSNEKLETVENEPTVDVAKIQPVFNKDDKMVFSKIDFAGLGNKKNKKGDTNPKKVLEQVQQVNDKIQKLKETGDMQKATEIKEKTAWKNALAKTQGVKVKDDPILLKKSIQKLEQKKRSSKKKWENRTENVKKAKEDKQRKRTENIEKRKKDKKLHKLKRASKKGKIIPGF